MVAKSSMLEEGKMNTQERILNVAEEEFANNGFSGTRIVDIAKKAKANQAMISYYFDSKENLYKLVLSRLFREWEIHVQALSWKEGSFEQVLGSYIRAHFEFQCKSPNLFKMHQWESLEGRNLFRQQSSTFWLRDMEEKIGIVEEWKKDGSLRPEVRGASLLYFIWGMMNQFYYRQEAELQAMLRKQGDLQGLREELIADMIAIIINGVRRQFAAWQPPAAVTVVVPAEADEEARALVELLSGRRELKVDICRGGELASEHVRESKVWFIIAGTAVGELPQPVVALLEACEAGADDRIAGIWTMSGPASDAVQRLAEDAVNRTGATAVSRAPGMTAETYIRRFAKLTKALTSQRRD